MTQVLVAGAGSPLRSDDGIGVRLIADLASWIESQGAHPIDIGTDAFGLVSRLPDVARVILLDAVDMGLKPGTVRVFDANQVPRSEAPLLSGHQFDLAGAIGLAERFYPATKIEVVGIQPANVEESDGLSASLARNYVRIRHDVRGRLDALLNEGKEDNDDRH